MDIVVSIITIVAGIIYFFYKLYKEEPDGFKSFFVSMLVFLGPYALWRNLMDSENQVVSVLGCVMLIVHIVIMFAYPHFDNMRQRNKWQNSMKDYEDCFRIKAEKLPEPDEETIRAYKIKTNQSLDPELDSVSRPVALRAWREDKIAEIKEEYRIRFNLDKKDL